MRKNLPRLAAGLFAAALIFFSASLPHAAAAADSQRQAPAAWNLDEKIHPELKRDFNRLPNIPDNLRDVRALRGKMTPDVHRLPTDDAVAVRNEWIPGGTEAPKLRVRIYEPRERQGDLPALLWMHGGGYLIGSPELDEGLLIQIAKALHCVVVAPDYRLAPEHEFPAAINDCYRTLRWMAESPNGLRIKKDRIAVAGASAGGGLAAAVALKARDEKGPEICFAMPLYPMLDHHNSTESSYQITDARVWNRKANETAWELYLGDGAKESVSPYAAPAVAEDLSGLPPTYMMVGELDLFRDEIIDYAKRLLNAGVPVELHIYPGAFHAFEGMIPEAKISREARGAYIKALGQALRGQRVDTTIRQEHNDMR